MNKIISIILTMIMVLGFTQTECEASTFKKSITITTQKQLNKQIKNKQVSKITIKSDKSKSITIPKGTYKKDIVINSNKLTVTNKAKLKSVTIKKAKKYTESANDNNVLITDNNLALSVAKNFSANTVTIANKTANVEAHLSGQIGVLNVLDGKKVELSGNRLIRSNIVVYCAKTEITANIPSETTFLSNCDLIANSDGNIVNICDENTRINVQNNSETDIPVYFNSRIKEIIHGRNYIEPVKENVVVNKVEEDKSTTNAISKKEEVNPSQTTQNPITSPSYSYPSDGDTPAIETKPNANRIPVEENKPIVETPKDNITDKEVEDAKEDSSQNNGTKEDNNSTIDDTATNNNGNNSKEEENIPPSSDEIVKDENIDNASNNDVPIDNGGNIDDNSNNENNIEESKPSEEEQSKEDDKKDDDIVENIPEIETEEPVEEILPISLSLSEQEQTLYAGNAFNLYATLENAEDGELVSFDIQGDCIGYEISDNAIKIYGLDEGTAKVVVSYGELEETCEVTVIPNVEKVYGIVNDYQFSVLQADTFSCDVYYVEGLVGGTAFRVQGITEEEAEDIFKGVHNIKLYSNKRMTKLYCNYDVIFDKCEVVENGDIKVTFKR